MRVVAVIGPTASGKSDLGFQIASHVGGEIISADSMQIYRGMDIGTAKPTLQQRSQIKHHLIDILDPEERFNAGIFADLAGKIIKTNTTKNIPSILVGGTGLYLKVLLYGITPAPEASEEVQTVIKDILDEKGVAGCYERLLELDRESADKLHPNDIARITRALQVILMTGRSLCDIQREHHYEEGKYEIFFVGINWPRNELYQRINVRVEEMVRQGLVEETKKLLDKGYSPTLQSLNSIGYKQASALIQGKINQLNMVKEIQQKSRHYAKKQITWYRKDQRIRWISPGESYDNLFEEIDRFLGR